MRAAKKTTYRTGLAAEALCRFALRLKGYRIVISRYRSHLGEIDIVASRGQNVALIEVKARPSRDEAIHAISQHQCERLERAAADFLAHYPQFGQHHIRFDVMLVVPRRWPAHLVDAWRPS